MDDPASPTMILARWREAQRQLDESALGSPDHDRLSERVHDLSEAYRAAVERRVDAAAPVAQTPITGHA
jgi:hypothetical protein